MPDTTPTPAEVIARAKADPQTLNLLRNVLDSQATLWNAMHELEKRMGCELPNLSDVAQTYCDADDDDDTLRAIVDKLEVTPGE